MQQCKKSRMYGTLFDLSLPSVSYVFTVVKTCKIIIKYKCSSIELVVWFSNFLDVNVTRSSRADIVHTSRTLCAVCAGFSQFLTSWYKLFEQLQLATWNFVMSALTVQCHMWTMRPHIAFKFFLGNVEIKSFI